MRSPFVPTHAMEGIVRIENATTGRWVVRFRRNRKTYVGHFADSHYCGKHAALKAAKAWRDEHLRDAQPMSSQAYYSFIRKNNTSGVTGVFRVKLIKKRKNGTRTEHWAWIAHSPTKPIRTRSFSIAKYGEQGAYDLAVAARKQFVAECEAPFLRNPPSDRHSKKRINRLLVGDEKHVTTL